MPGRTRGGLLQSALRAGHGTTGPVAASKDHEASPRVAGGRPAPGRHPVQGAAITGTWNGSRVASSYSRLDSCKTTHWNKLRNVFGQVNPGGPRIRASGEPPSS